MTDTYANYADLAAAQIEGTDYARRSVPVTGATWCSIAIHGGGIEPGSGEMARYVAAGRMAHYEFAGLLASGNSVLHITSTNFDEPNALAMVAAAKRCLSFHGAAGTPGTPMTFLGGLDTATGARVAARLTAAGFAVTMASEELNANSTSNITNKTSIAAGVQLEMSNALRASFFPNGDLSRTMRDSGQRTDTFYAYAAAILSAYDGRGMVSLGSVNVSRWALVPAPKADADITVTMATDVLAAGGSHFLALAVRVIDTSNAYLARLEFSTTQAVIITLRKRVAGTETLLAQETTALTHAANTQFRMRMQIQGATLRARVWLASSYEPVGWDVEVTDSDLTVAGSVGVRAILSTSNTNTLPVTASFDSLTHGGSTQLFTVARSVNGVVKTHQAGEQVRLARPMIVAL